MSTEERVITDDIFVPEFSIFLDSQDYYGKEAFVRSIFYNPHAPQNKEDPMIINILLRLVGMSKDRYNMCKKYGHGSPFTPEYRDENNAFRDFSRWEQQVHKDFDTKPVNKSQVSTSIAKTLPFTAEIRVYINKLYEDYENAEPPFRHGKYREYLEFLKRTVEVFQIFKNNLSDTPDEDYAIRIKYV